MQRMRKHQPGQQRKEIQHRGQDPDAAAGGCRPEHLLVAGYHEKGLGTGLS